MLRKYCKTHYLRETKQAGNWGEAIEGENAGLMSRDGASLWNDFTVVRSPIVLTTRQVSGTIPLEWQSVCTRAGASQ